MKTKKDVLPPGYRITLDLHYHRLFAPDGREIITQTRNEITSGLIDAHGRNGDERREAAMRQIAREDYKRRMAESKEDPIMFELRENMPRIRETISLMSVEEREELKSDLRGLIEDLQK